MVVWCFVLQTALFFLFKIVYLVLFGIKDRKIVFFNGRLCVRFLLQQNVARIFDLYGYMVSARCEEVRGSEFKVINSFWKYSDER